ncbi:MAG TPA: TatD family hydrolase, partial [Chlamydiales bacterium]|nr:TatD family hydrolase [Chlamydiales bacterium]
MTIIDTHCHITMDNTISQSTEIIKKAIDVNVKKMICVCTNLCEYEKAKELKKLFPQNLFLAAATT